MVESGGAGHIGRMARMQRVSVRGEMEPRQAEVDSDVDGATRALGGVALGCQRDALDQAEPRDQRPRQSPFAGDAVIEALPDPAKQSAEIGRASCRERVCQYV